MTTTQPTVPAIYVGSLPEFHGPITVGLDTDSTRKHGDLRFYGWTPEGELLTGIRVTSLSFTAPRPAPIRVEARDAMVALAPAQPKDWHEAMGRPYCRKHDIFDCPYEGN